MMYTHNGFVVSQGNEWVLMGRPLTQLVSLDYNELLGMGGGGSGLQDFWGIFSSNLISL